MHLLPNTEKLDRIPVPKPVRDKEVSVLCLEHVRQGNEDHVIFRIDRDLSSPYINFGIASSGYFPTIFPAPRK